MSKLDHYQRFVLAAILSVFVVCLAHCVQAKQPIPATAEGTALQAEAATPTANINESTGDTNRVMIAPQTEGRKTMNVLIIGNSWMHGLRDNLQNVLTENGHPAKVVCCLQGSETMKGHWYGNLGMVPEHLTNQPAKAAAYPKRKGYIDNALTKTKFDVCIIQPAIDMELNPAESCQYGKLLADKVRASSPDCKMFVFERFARPTGPESRTYEGWKKRNVVTRENIQTFAATNHLTIIPSARIWETAMATRKTPEELKDWNTAFLYLYSTADRFHPGVLGSYINLCATFCALTGKSPANLAETIKQGLTSKTVPAEDAALIKKLVWDACQEPQLGLVTQHKNAPPN